MSGHEENIPVIITRGYQQELLEESLRRNIVIALDTGSGKTHIAMLRMKHEVEHNTDKVSWFVAPTVTLIEQQRSVIAAAIPVPVGLISGASAPDQWKNAELWSSILAQHRIVVSTPQILLDALRHGYINLGRDVSLLVFDEAHHAMSKHPYNEIMRGFYHPLPPRQDIDRRAIMRPAILGLTASPIYSVGDIEKSFREIETNLDSVIRSSRFNREELATFVHRPEFRYVLYTQGTLTGVLSSRYLNSLAAVVGNLDIEHDPYVIALRSQLAKLPPGEQRNRVDQKLSKTLVKEDSFTHKGLRDFLRTATDICAELGPWPADWYIASIIQAARREANLHTGVLASWQDREKNYLLRVLSRVDVESPSYDPDDIRAGISSKVQQLVKCLHSEKRRSNSEEEPFSGIVFVTRRDAVLSLAKVISALPDMEDFRVGCLLGTSASFKRHAFLDISRSLLRDSATQVLNDFRTGDKNLVVSTSVAEEGIDIQACGTVIRFDPPDNMVSWAQSRGRARRRRSTFLVMLGSDSASEKIKAWEEMEKAMIKLYTDPSRANDPPPESELDEDLEFVVPETGAKLTLDSAVSHLYHFCSILPHSSHAVQGPVFDLDPPDYQEGWHSFDPRYPPAPYPGPWGATCTLPRQVPKEGKTEWGDTIELRKFETSVVYPTKQSARNHAAFFAYHRLYQVGLLNDHLLPHTSEIYKDEDGAVKLLLQDIEKRAGMAKTSIQYDPWQTTERTGAWYYNEVAIPGLPRLFMFTRQRLEGLSADELPVLYIPGRNPPATRVDIFSLPDEMDEDGAIAAAQEYTRRIFLSSYDTRMDPARSDFPYLFLPMEAPADEAKWETRREWMQRRVSAGEHGRTEGPLRASADALGRQFNYPNNLASVRSNRKFDKPLRFRHWRHEPLSAEEHEEFVEQYVEEPSYPLIVAEAYPRRRNFLEPLESADAGLADDRQVLLHPKYSTIDLVSADDLQFATLLPSLLRFASISATVHAMRTTLFAASPRLASIPFALLRPAQTAPVATDLVNYERLETLGDTVLKYIVSILLHAQYPLWHEGYLARRKDHAVNNNKLAKDAIRMGLQTWIIRDRFAPKKWKPRYIGDTSAPATPAEGGKEEAVLPDAPGVNNANGGDEELKDNAENKEETQAQPAEDSKTTDGEKKKKRKKKQKTQDLSTKMLADVVESLIGAAYEHGGFDLATECAELFHLGIDTWEPVSACVEKSLSHVEKLSELPPELELVERMIDYQFTNRTLLVEALTHASYTGSIETQSYERLEFIGDAVLDMVVTDFLYHAPGRQYSPGHMHIRKEALVNAHLLAFVCMRAHVDIDAAMPGWTAQDGIVLNTATHRIALCRCLLHSSTKVLDDLNLTYARWERHGDAIARALAADGIYPWAALTSLQAPKFVSDMLESILGAVFLDAHGDLGTVRGVLRTLGVMQLMERIVADDVDVLHPVSRLAIWAAKNERKWAIKSERIDGDISCYVKIDDVEEFRATEPFRGRASQNEVRFAAAEGAIRKLHVIEEEVAADIDEVVEEGVFSEEWFRQGWD
ncbi:Dicer-like protein 2 [Phanerochaete sordida]|uniref:Dicer-like protein 2 n=1 Tax=Phanerochaete sordida TaxID=48140 RepID=A0A9P3G5T3_9APHY|nr:Dicer-like protein 2 [Phanerochaete sordida]